MPSEYTLFEVTDDFDPYWDLVNSSPAWIVARMQANQAERMVQVTDLWAEYGYAITWTSKFKPLILRNLREVNPL